MTLGPSASSAPRNAFLPGPGGRYDVLKIAVSGRPTKQLASPLDGRDELRGISLSALDLSHFELFPSDAPDSVDDLPHGIAKSSAEIDTLRVYTPVN